jgi:hypothetical protein
VHGYVGAGMAKRAYKRGIRLCGRAVQVDQVDRVCANCGHECKEVAGANIAKSRLQ